MHIELQQWYKDFHYSHLHISTLSRTWICVPEQSGRWSSTQLFPSSPMQCWVFSWTPSWQVTTATPHYVFFSIASIFLSVGKQKCNSRKSNVAYFQNRIQRNMANVKTKSKNYFSVLETRSTTLVPPPATITPMFQWHVVSVNPSL